MKMNEEVKQNWIKLLLIQRLASKMCKTHIHAHPALLCKAVSSMGQPIQPGELVCR